MSLHKKRVKLKQYSKAGIFLNLKKGPSPLVTKQKINFYSPDLNYLNSKLSKKIKENFQTSLITRRKLKLFFGFYRTSLLKKYIKTEITQNKKSWRHLNEIEFCSLLERRLDILLYRLGFVSSLFEARHLISHKKIKINNCLNSSFSRLLNKGDIISFVPSIEMRIKERLKQQITNRNFYFNNFSNVEVNLKTLKIVILREKIDLAKQIQHYSFALNWNLVSLG